MMRRTVAPLLLVAVSAVACASSLDENIASESAGVGSRRAEWRVRRTSGDGKFAVPRTPDWKCATDPVPKRVLCVPGATTIATNAESATAAPTFALSGDTYSEVASAAQGPSGRQWFSIATFASQGKVVVFGGYQRQGDYLDDTWTWNGSSWTLETPAHKPPARAGAVLAFDGKRERLVLSGGGAHHERFRDIWEWDGQDWSRRPDSPTYPSAKLPVAATVPGRGFLVLDAMLGSAWLYEDGVFKETSRLSHRQEVPFPGALAYNESRGTLEAFFPEGGIYEGRISAMPGTSEPEVVWTPVDATSPVLHGPPARLSSAAYDPTTKNVVAFNGAAAHELLWLPVPNTPPRIRQPANTSTFAEEVLSFQLELVDVDDPPSVLSVTAPKLPAGAAFDTATRTFTWKPTASQKGTHTARFEARDSSAVTSLDVNIEVFWNEVALLPKGPIDLVTTGSEIPLSYEPSVVVGTVTLPAIFQRLDRGGRWVAEPFPFGFAPPTVGCHLAGNNPGKVTATCLRFHGGPSYVSSSVVASNGFFSVGTTYNGGSASLLHGPTGELSVRFQSYVVDSPHSHRMTSTGVVDSMLRPRN